MKDFPIDVHPPLCHDLPPPQAGELSLPSTLSVYSANSVARHDLNSGDKIILSPYILLACEHKEITYPMVSSGEGGVTCLVQDGGGGVAK